MLSRTILSSLMLLILTIFLLANCAPSPQERSTLPLTPPPLTAQAARVGPLSSQPTASLTTTAVDSSVAPLTSTLPEAAMVSVTPTVSMTQVMSTTPAITATATITEAMILTTTPVAILLPTATPTPMPDLVLLPTPTPASTTEAPRTAVATSTDTSLITGQITGTALITSTVFITGIDGDRPAPFITLTVPLPASYQAEGTFTSQTIYTDSTTTQQQGGFTIRQAAAANAYGANQHYMLRTQRAVGESAEDGQDEINVYQVDDYVAVHYTGAEWMLVRRDQGSNIVRSIQPITDLALLLPRAIDQAELIGQEEIAGVSTLHYRLDDPAGQGARLIQPLLALTGEIRSLTLDVWIAVPGGYVVSYNFQVELSGARVLDANLNQTRADQTVTWTYELTPIEDPEPVLWPDNAPTPDAFPVPGFGAGDFPMPPNTELLAFVGGVPDLVSTLTAVEVDSFYRVELQRLGWHVEGEGGLLRCSKEGASFQLLISAESATGGTQITILPEG